MSLQTEPVFVGATRPTLMFGVTLDFLIANMMISAIAFLVADNLLWLALCIPLHAIAYLLCKNEPRMLSLLGLWSKTKGASLNRGHWKASSTSPLDVMKRKLTHYPKRAVYNRENAAARHMNYTVLIDEATVRTENKDLFRVFRIEGVAHESADDEDLNAWQTGLNQLIKNIAGPNVALHTHIVRRVKNDYPKGTFKDGFAADLNNKYRDSLKGARMMVNELYLTVIYRPSEDQPIKGFGRIMEALAKPSRDKLFSDLEDQVHALDELCAQINTALHRYEPRMLKTYDKAGVSYSETLEFLGFLLNGEKQHVPVPRASIKHALATARLFFGKEAIEQRGLTDSHISAIVAVKEYPDTSVSTMLDGMLEAPYEFILSQSFTCLGKQAATSKLRITRDRMINAGDLAESQIVQLNDALDDLTSNRFVMGVHSLTLQVRSKDLKQLGDDLAQARTIMSDVGMVVVREDVALEGAFWSQLPCNFAYRPRPAPITSRNFAGFASLHNYPMGKPTHNYWGDAVALLKTASGAPYYFNFHRADLGHTTIIGPSGSGKTVTQGFLIAMLEKFSPTMVFFDKDRGAEIFVRAQRGFYMPLQMGKPTGFNPFQQPLTPGYELFLVGLIKSLVQRTDSPFSPKDEDDIQNAIKGVYNLPKHGRRMKFLLEFLDPTDPNGIAARLQKWCGQGSLAWVFDNEDDMLDFSRSRLFGFDVTEFLDNGEVRTPIILYLFERMKEVIDGRRFCCFMDEFWKLLLDQAFEDIVRDALKTWRKLDAFLVTGTQSPSDTLTSPIAKTIIEQSPTQIFMPNAKADPDDYINGFKLSNREFEIIRTLGDQSRRFLIKQGPNSVVAELNLNGFDDELAVLSGTASNVEIMQAAIQEEGMNPDKWLPAFQRKRRVS